MRNPTGIKKLPNGKWEARYFAGFDSKAKRSYPSQRFDTQAEAVKWRNQQTGSKATSGARVLEQHDLTVGQYLDQYLAIKRAQIRANTFETYSKTARNYIKADLGEIKLTRLRPLHLATWQSNLVQRVAANTARSAQVILDGALEQAVSLQLISTNPLAGLALPKKGKPKFHALTVEEALAYLKACKDRTHGLVLRVALETGLRPEEYLGLKWADIALTSDRTKGVLTVRQVVQWCRGGGGGWRWEEPKTAKGKRRVCFPIELYQALQEHRRRQLEIRMQCGGEWNTDDRVFCSSVGTPVFERVLVAEHRAALTAAGIPRIRLYDLRHAFVTFSLLAGVDPKTVSAEAGHASVAFTLDTYGHVLQEQFEGASDKRAALFAGRQAVAK